jgi:hypothetical protein
LKTEIAAHGATDDGSGKTVAMVKGFGCRH